MSKSSDEAPAGGTPPATDAEAEARPFGAAVTVPGGQSSFGQAITVTAKESPLEDDTGELARPRIVEALSQPSAAAESSPSRSRRARPPPRPEDAELPGPPASPDISDDRVPVKRPNKPESKFPEIDAAIRIVDVDTRPLERRSTALNPWNLKTPGLGVEAMAALDALKDGHRPAAVGVEPGPRRRLFVLLALATGAAVLVFVIIVGGAQLNRGWTVSDGPDARSAQLKLPEILVPPPPFDEAVRLAKREAMIAAFDRHDFSQGIAFGEELEAAGALDVEAEFWLADACRHANRAAEAVRRYEAFIRAHPGHKLVDVAHYNAAEMARHEGKSDVARTHYKAIIADEKSGLRAKAKNRLQSLR
jgi:hypothetical protein